MSRTSRHSPSEPLPAWVSSIGPIPASAAWHCDRLPVWCVSVELAPWPGPEVNETQRNKSVHCGKGRGLVVGADGRLSCGEVEIVRRMREAGWRAGWVQPYVCGRSTWASWIASADDECERLLSFHGLSEGLVATLRGWSERGAPGHPDVVAWRGDQTVFIEYKGAFDRGGLNDNQAAWFHAANLAGLATAANYVVVTQRT